MQEFFDAIRNNYDVMLWLWIFWVFSPPLKIKVMHHHHAHDERSVSRRVMDRVEGGK